MSTLPNTRAEIIAEYRTNDKDTGSPEIQIAILTRRISDLTGHVRIHKHDFHSRRGLIMMVGKRNRLLRYIARNDRGRYQNLIQRLGLRK